MSLSVEKLLQDKGITYRLVHLKEKAFTVDDVVKYSEGDIRPEEICKTIIVRGKKTNVTVAILLRGNDKLNFTAIKKQLGEEATVARPEQVQEASGVEPGAVCPFLLNIPLYVDLAVLRLGAINCGSGDHLFGLELSTQDLAKGATFTSGDFAKPTTTAAGKSVS